MNIDFKEFIIAYANTVNVTDSYILAVKDMYFVIDFINKLHEDEFHIIKPTRATLSRKNGIFKNYNFNGDDAIVLGKQEESNLPYVILSKLSNGIRHALDKYINKNFET